MKVEIGTGLPPPRLVTGGVVQDPSLRPSGTLFGSLATRKALALEFRQRSHERGAGEARHVRSGEPLRTPRQQLEIGERSPKRTLPVEPGDRLGIMAVNILVQFSAQLKENRDSFDIYIQEVVGKFFRDVL